MPTHQNQSIQHVEIDRLITTAIVSTRFRELLLSDPTTALTDGYNGYNFNLSTDEQTWLIGIEAKNLDDFVTQVMHQLNKKPIDQTINGNDHSVLANGSPDSEFIPSQNGASS